MAALKKQVIDNQELIENTIEDYTQNMFADGNNRTKKIRNANAYDNAVETTDPEIAEADIASSLPLEPAESRDGTQASGALDEDGGTLGGTEAELDSMEASAAPVDRTPQMKA